MNIIQKQTKRIALSALMCTLLGLSFTHAEGAESSKNAHFIEISDTTKVEKSVSDSTWKQKENVFIDYETMPSFRGGNTALLEWLDENMRYPDELADSCIQGRVIVTFVINEDGHISDEKILRSLDPLLDAEALRLVRAMPRWSPGRQFGKVVKVRYCLPINFKLK